MKVLKNLDPADELQPIENALIYGKVIRGITEADFDLFCVCRLQRSIRDLTDSITGAKTKG